MIFFGGEVVPTASPGFNGWPVMQESPTIAAVPFEPTTSGQMAQPGQSIWTVPAGPNMTGPGMTGPGMTGPGMTGPGMTGPSMTGPSVAPGPLAWTQPPPWVEPPPWPQPPGWSQLPGPSTRAEALRQYTAALLQRCYRFMQAALPVVPQISWLVPILVTAVAQYEARQYEACLAQVLIALATMRQVQSTVGHLPPL